VNGLAYLVVALVATQRVLELQYARRNTGALIRRGAVEFGRGHYPFIVALHAAWLAAILFALPAHVSIGWPWLTAFALLQMGRIWVIASLKSLWTTRIITLPGEPLVRRGPYRLLRHPNYLIVVLEIAVLPTAFGEYAIAAIFSLLNAALLGWRIREEERALRSRRDLMADPTGFA